MRCTQLCHTPKLRERLLGAATSSGNRQDVIDATLLYMAVQMADVADYMTHTNAGKYPCRISLP
jgi:hypothetical protein